MDFAEEGGLTARAIDSRPVPPEYPVHIAAFAVFRALCGMVKASKNPVIVLVAAAIISVGSCSLQSRNRTHALDQIAAGDSEGHVVELLGKPDVREMPDRPFLRYATQGCISPCAIRLWWEWPLPLGIEAWSVELDASQTVIETAHWVSP